MHPLPLRKEILKIYKDDFWGLISIAERGT